MTFLSLPEGACGDVRVRSQGCFHGKGGTRSHRTLKCIAAPGSDALSRGRQRELHVSAVVMGGGLCPTGRPPPHPREPGSVGTGVNEPQETLKTWLGPRSGRSLSPSRTWRRWPKPAERPGWLYVGPVPFAPSALPAHPDHELDYKTDPGEMLCLLRSCLPKQAFILQH